MLWISGGISVALFIYLFHALIKPERYRFAHCNGNWKNIGEPYERSAFRAVHARVLRVDGRFHQRPGQDLSERRHVQ
ncbi:K(+)-transporting ATPase subunit F [Burkholderia ubonensis]|uniref:K(+)-transporting ATPase subunit F n=1 Tax=Burkholderia ubonensis TaxID=101571 RepID=UPI0009B49111